MMDAKRPFFLLAALSAALFTRGLPHADAAGVLDLDDAAVRRLAALPVQEGGRIKPFDTWAGFKLLRLNGRRAVETPEGNSLSPAEWAAVCLFQPGEARRYRFFRVDNTEVLTAIGVPHEEKRGRYAYDDIAPGRERLAELARQYASRPAADRPPVETQLINLYTNLLEFEAMAGFLDFAREVFSIDPESRLGEIFSGKDAVRLTDFLEKRNALHALFAESPHDETASEDAQDLAELVQEMDQLLYMADMLALFPPIAPEASEWLSPAKVIEAGLSGGGAAAPHRELLAVLETMARNPDSADFGKKLKTFCAESRELAKKRGEYGRVELEVLYYRFAFFYNSLILFILSFVLLSLSLLAPRSRIFYAVTWLAVTAPALYASAGIAMRCVIRGRPPVTTLYETILFVTITAVLVCLFLEYVNRRRIALFLASFLGMLGLFVAYKYEMKEGVDTMPSMVAVLNTNFWLATHVTTITIGYAAGLLAGALAHVYVFARLFRFRRSDPEFYRQLSRMVYGVLCFGLLFSILGTVLGGIWANESWGRFWGWDPKENGALMIVLWQLAILHARLGGYIRQTGLHLAAIFGGVIVVFSWFGVNLLGVGLHTYGFTSGAQGALMTFYALEAIVLLLGVIAWTMDSSGAAAPRPDTGAGGAD
jgi:ABC-type transport system involved in cytochrome c biogenesis permease subunit